MTPSLDNELETLEIDKNEIKDYSTIKAKDMVFKKITDEDIENAIKKIKNALDRLEKL